METIVKEKLYSDLAWIWPVMSPPEDYIDEVNFFFKLIDKYAKQQTITVLNLGCGGGHIDKTLKTRFDITGVDKSEAMLELARRLNPEATYIPGDMRNVRLGKLFDIVLVHDAISYMLTEEDLQAVFETAHAHLKPGGLFLTVVEETPETFKQNKVVHYTHSQNGLEITSVEYFHDLDTTNTTYRIVFVYYIKQNNNLRVEVDNHTCGIFPLNTWYRTLKAADFEDIQREYFHAVLPYDCDFNVLVAKKPEK